MTTIIIAEGITLTATEETARECEWLVEEPKWRRQAFNWLLEAAEAGDWSFYSDLHKDLFGVRP